MTFKGANETRDHVFQNEKPVKGGVKDVRGLQWSGAFGALLKPIFDPQCPVHFEFEKRTSARGLLLAVYRFSTPPDSCALPSYSDSERYYAGRRGEVSIDEATGNIIQFDDASTGYPAQYPFAESNREIVWDYIKIGDVSHLLPVSADDIARFSAGSLICVNLKYTNHRHFEAASSITFQ